MPAVTSASSPALKIWIGMVVPSAIP